MKMTNIEALEMAVQIMKAHNSLIGYETFKSIAFDRAGENIMFRCRFQFLKSAFDICELLNLNCTHSKEDVYIIM